MLRIETRRGAVEVKVRSDRDVPEGMVFMPFCYAEAAANLLTNPALDPMGKIPEFKFLRRARVAAGSQSRSRRNKLTTTEVSCG
jgi:predicted molibdopterin-dependent oxidoreductase YjgC